MKTPYTVVVSMIAGAALGGAAIHGVHAQLAAKKAYTITELETLDAKAAADFAIYTPGSGAGIPVSIVRSFAAPPAALREDAELFRERVATTATSLLALIGIPPDSEITVGVDGELGGRDTPLRDGADLMLLSPMEGGSTCPA